MMRPDSLRITGALLFSLLIHGLLLGLAGRSGHGITHVPAARKTVFMRLVPRPAGPAARPVAVPSRPSPVQVAKRVPEKEARRPRPVSTPVVRPVSPASEPPISPAVAPPEPAPPPVTEISEPARPAALSAEGTVGEAESRQAAEITPSTTTEAAAGDRPRPDGDAGGTGEEGGVLVLARPLYRRNIPPFYPDPARRRGWQGTVVLEVRVGTDGRVSDLAVHESSGHSILDEAALAAVRDWRFEPGRRGGTPEAMKVLVPVRFGLE